MTTKIMLGNEAFARGAYEAGVTVVSSYPGTPSTEITEYAVKYPEIYGEWAPNEKVAAEVVIGAGIGGARSLSAMKHVGLNVAADPFFTAAYTGVNGGVVFIVADDNGCHSSQNEQDSRFYARSAGVPMLEPASAQECKDFVKLAFDLSEMYDTPILIRSNTRISHSRGIVKLEHRQEVPLRAYTKDIKKYVAMPTMAKMLHIAQEKRLDKFESDSNTFGINRAEYADLSLGIVTSGICYQYAKEALPEASVLKLGSIFPLPKALIKEFAEKVETLIVMADMPDVFIPAVDLFGGLGDGNVVFAGIFHHLFSGGESPGWISPGSDDFDGGIQGLDGGLKPDLIVALAGATVANIISPFFLGDFNQFFGHQRSGHGGAKHIFILIYGTGFEGGPDEICDEFILDVHNVCLDSTCGIGLFFNGFKIFYLTCVAAYRNHITVIYFLKPRDDDGRVQSA